MKNINKSHTVKTAEHILTGFAIAIKYLENIKCKIMNIFVIEEKTVWMYLPRG